MSAYSSISLRKEFLARLKVEADKEGRSVANYASRILSAALEAEQVSK